MAEAMVFLQDRIKQMISRGNVSGDTPSRPGTPPKVQTGRLRSSIHHAVGKRRGNVIGQVGSNVEYAIHLEFGAPAINLEPRPFFRPGLLKNIRGIMKRFSE